MDEATDTEDSILPALAFSLDMFAKTAMSFGVNEVLLASALGSVVFAVFAAQPLVIVGVTGMGRCVVASSTYQIHRAYHCFQLYGIRYHHTQRNQLLCFYVLDWAVGYQKQTGRMLLLTASRWSLVMHWILAITNACDALTYVTRFSCDIFGFYVAFIYLQKGIQVLTRQWDLADDTSAYLSIMVALLVLMAAYLCEVIGHSHLFQLYIRKFIEDYGTPLTIVFFTGFVHIGRTRSVDLQTLPTSRAFYPTQDRGWFVHFWEIDVGDVFIAIPFAVLLTILFYFDHNGKRRLSPRASPRPSLNLT